MEQWKPGDIANGHVLTSSGWVPFRPRAANAGPPFEPGDVINGHVFTGSTWAPVPASPRAPAAPPGSTPVPGSAPPSPPAQSAPPAPSSLPPSPSGYGYGALPPTHQPPKPSAAKRILIIVGACVGVILVIGIIGAALDGGTDGGGGDGGSSDGALGPEGQQPFLDAVKAGQDSDASNEIQVVEAKKVRADALCDILPDDLKVDDWVGTVDTVDTELGGDRGILTLKVADGVKISTATGFLDTDTMVDPDSPLYSSIGQLKPGDEVTFSGQFEDDDDDCIKEDSLIDENGLRTPTFLITFSAVE